MRRGVERKDKEGKRVQALRSFVAAKGMILGPGWRPSKLAQILARVLRVCV